MTTLVRLASAVVLLSVVIQCPTWAEQRPNGDTAATSNIATSDGSDTCVIQDLESLKLCTRNRGKFRNFNVIKDIECSGDSCCSGDALIVLDAASNLLINGNQHTITRHSQQRTCSAVSGRGASGVSIKDLNFEEESSTPPCDPGSQPCAATIAFGNATRIDIENVRIYDAKGFAVSAVATDGFTFDQSAIISAGVIGLYVGSSSGGAMSDHIKVTNSVFSRTRTNAIALNGVKGQNQADNLIEGNVFTQNHYHGLYLDAKNKANNGGQIYLPNVTNATIKNNLIGIGYCPICDNTMVWGVELGITSSVSFLSNIFFDSYGVAFFKDSSATIDSSDEFRGNTIYNLNGLTLAGPVNGLGNATISQNTVGSPIRSKPGDPDPTYSIFRINLNGRHYEATTEDSAKRGVVEATFALSPSPRIGAPLNPILGCTLSGDKSGDGNSEFPSNSRNCEGQTIRKVLGYSFESKYPGAAPLFRCRKENDHFSSWDPHCEGQIVEGALGYALHKRPPA